MIWYILCSIPFLIKIEIKLMKGIYVINYIYLPCIKFSFYFFKNINIYILIYYMTNFKKEMKSDFDFYFKFWLLVYKNNLEIYLHFSKWVSDPAYMYCYLNFIFFFSSFFDNFEKLVYKYLNNGHSHCY